MEALLLQEEASARHAAVSLLWSAPEGGKAGEGWRENDRLRAKNAKTGRVCQQNAE